MNCLFSRANKENQDSKNITIGFPTNYTDTLNLYKIYI